MLMHRERRAAVQNDITGDCQVNLAMPSEQPICVGAQTGSTLSKAGGDWDPPCFSERMCGLRQRHFNMSGRAAPFVCDV